MIQSRRAFLATAAAFGIGVEMLAAPAYAAIGGGANRKLVTVVLRGGMDGLSAVPPVGEANYAALRGVLAIPAEQALKVDSTFSLHPALPTLHRLIQSGQGRIAPAIATPDRARSHFEAQDVLESGAASIYGDTSGWLNRALGALGPDRKTPALSVGATAPLILRGPNEAGSWSPGRSLSTGDRLPMLISEMYSTDQALSMAFAQGLKVEDMAAQAAASSQTMGAAAGQSFGRTATQAQGQEAARGLGRTVAGFMNQPDGPRVVALSIDGYDTHANQGNVAGTLANRLGDLDALINGLSSGLGPAWNDTAVVVATEFGRTARINGAAGTDHGTGSTAFVLGGAVKPGGIIGDWPGLADGALFENRDLRPSLDMRGLFKGLLAEQLGIDRKALDGQVFPDSADIAPVTGLLRA